MLQAKSSTLYYRSVKPDPSVVFKALSEALRRLRMLVSPSTELWHRGIYKKVLAFTTELAVARPSSVLARRHLTELELKLQKAWRNFCGISSLLSTTFTHEENAECLAVDLLTTALLVQRPGTSIYRYAEATIGIPKNESGLHRLL